MTQKKLVSILIIIIAVVISGASVTATNAPPPEADICLLEFKISNPYELSEDYELAVVFTNTSTGERRQILLFTESGLGAGARYYLPANAEYKITAVFRSKNAEYKIVNEDGTELADCYGVVNISCPKQTQGNKSNKNVNNKYAA